MAQKEINWLGIGFGLALMVLAAYQQLKLPPVLPILLEEYGFDRILAGGFMSVYPLCGLVLSLRLGGMMQRRGTAFYLNIAFGLFAAAAVIMMLWPEIGWLFLLARGLEGLAFSILAIAGPAICTGNAGPGGLAIAAAIIATWIPAGGLIANAVAAALGDGGAWRVLWAVGIAASLVMALWMRRLAASGAITLSAGEPPAPTDSQNASNAPEARRQWRIMAFSGLLFSFFSIGMFAYLTWVPDYLVETQGYTADTAATLFMLPVAVLTAFNLLAAPILRAGVPVAILLAIAGGLQAAMWLLMPYISGVPAAIAAFLIFPMAAGVTPTCLYVLPGTVFGHERAGTRSFAVLMTGRNLGVLTGPLLAGALVQVTGDWTAAPLAIGGISLLLAVGALWLHRDLVRLGVYGTKR